MQGRKRSSWLAAWTAVLGLVPSLAAQPRQPGELLSPPKVVPSPRGEEIPPPSRQEMPRRSSELPPAPPVAPPLPAGLAVLVPPVEAVLRPGDAVTLRIRQVLPADGFSPGERLLNSHNPIQPGDHFLAEIVKPSCPPPVLVGGTVMRVVRPGWFGRPGYVTLQLSQIVESVDGQARLLPWQLDLADRRTTTQMRRALITALFGLEGAILGASIAFQNPNNPAVGAAVAGAAGGGLLLGLGYASFQRGLEASLEPGDTFRIVVGTMSYHPLPRDLQTILYPAADPSKHNRKTLWKSPHDHPKLASPR